MTTELASKQASTMRTSEAIDALATALTKAQAVMEGAKKDSTNPFFHSNYADLAEVWDTARKPLTDNGLSVVQTIGVTRDMFLAPIPVKDKQGNMTGTKDGMFIWVTLTTRLLHSSAQWIEGEINMPTEADPQALGRVTTYLRRYGLMAICGIAPEDDDGNTASGRTVQTSEPQSAQHQRCAIHNIPYQRFEKEGRTWYSHKTPDGKWCRMPDAPKPAPQVVDISQGQDISEEIFPPDPDAPSAPANRHAAPAQAAPASQSTAVPSSATLPEPPEVRHVGALFTYGRSIGFSGRVGIFKALGIANEQALGTADDLQSAAAKLREVAQAGQAS